ncbi:MAG: tyrosine recombinase XerC [Actinomycetales bacterium]
MLTWQTRLGLLRQSTQLAYRIHIHRHLIPTLGHIPLHDLQPRHIDDLVHDLVGCGLAAGTIARIIATLRSACTAAIRYGHLTCNPATGIRIPTPPTPRALPWGPRHARALLAGTTGVMHILLRLALATGMRRGELLGLRWTDIDLHAGCLHVRTARITVGQHTIETPPKTNAGARTIWLDPHTRTALATWQTTATTQWVFTDTNGEPFQPWQISRTFTTITTQLGLPAIRFHDLRHLSARLGLATGEPLPAVSERLGHSAITTTARIYGKTPAGVAQASARRRAQLIEGAA